MCRGGGGGCRQKSEEMMSQMSVKQAEMLKVTSELDQVKCQLSQQRLRADTLSSQVCDDVE